MNYIAIKSGTYEILLKFLELYLILPVTTAFSEWSFYTQKQIKNYLHNTIQKLSGSPSNGMLEGSKISNQAYHVRLTPISQINVCSPPPSLELIGGALDSQNLSVQLV